MSVELKAPAFPESVSDGELAAWRKQPGEAVRRDEVLAEVETDKVVIEVAAPADGVLAEVLKGAGETVTSGELIGRIEAGLPGAADAASNSAAGPAAAGAESRIGPAARRFADEADIDPSRVSGTGKHGLITKGDLQAYLQHRESAPPPAREERGPAPTVLEALAVRPAGELVAAPARERVERRVPMTRMRKRIAERLLEAARNTAMLTTFNEVNMAPLMALRARYQEEFEQMHDARLGYMGMFVKACCEALKRFPAVNASIDGDDVVYHGYQDIGVAVSTEQGLVVPVLRDADFMSVADVEAKIRDFGQRAREAKLSIEEMTGGTFTITNGGVFGSLLSTPILNPPQTGILGMHKIQERPVAVNGKVAVLPMMYLALSYDHRLIDGRDAVQFLGSVKDLIEDPARILLQL